MQKGNIGYHVAKKEMYRMENNKKATIEAILFAMGESVEISKIAEVIEEDIDTTKAILDEMMQDYKSSDRGITIVELENSIQLSTKTYLYDELIKVVKNDRKPVLTDTVIETLSIIAYKQPITRTEIEKIRGVSCDHAVNKLLEFELIKELGRLNAPGKPLLFGTSEQFLRSFGVSSLSDLPIPSEEQLEEFKAQVEEEIKIQVPI